MSEMVERVARAIALETLMDNGHTADSAASYINKGLWSDYVEEAKAAILAMREPTNVMLDCPSPMSRKSQWQ